MEEVREVKAGLGRALLAAKRDDNGIAILYSAASRFGTALLPQDTEPIKREDGTIDALPTEQDRAGYGWQKAFKSWGALIEDIGLQYRVISYEELADGLLAKEGYKVLVLPYSVALSDAEVAAITDFVSAGGTVYADRKPAVLDEHCKRRSSWALADVFGRFAGWTARDYGSGHAVLTGSAVVDYHENYRKNGQWANGASLRTSFKNSLNALTTDVTAFAEVHSISEGFVPSPVEVPYFNTTGMVSRWSFDNSSDPGGDDYGANDGTLNGGPTWISDGEGGGALDFDGVDDYVALPANENTSLKTNVSTFLIWMNIRSVGANSYASAYSGYSGWVENTVNINIRPKGTTNTGVDIVVAPGAVYHFDASINLNRWYHFALIIDHNNNTMKTYVNGSLIDTLNFTAFTPYNPSPRLGSNQATGNTGDYFDGKMDDVLIYNRALSDAEIQQIYNDTMHVEDALAPTEVFVFNNDPVTYVGLLRDYQLRDYSSHDAVVKLKEARHVYDMRTGEYLGEADTFTTKLDYRAKLYACLPYRVGGLDVVLAGEARRGQAARVKVSLKTEGETAAADHVFRIRLLDGAGKEIDGFSRNRTSRSGRLEEEIFLPYNLPAGVYRLAVRDIISGLEARQDIMSK